MDADHSFMRVFLARGRALILEIRSPLKQGGEMGNKILKNLGIGLMACISGDAEVQRKLRLVLLYHRIGADAGEYYAERFESQAGLRRASPW